MTRNDIVKILKAHQGALSDEYGVQTLELFGSRARGEEKPTSDLDFLVTFGRPIGLLHLIGTEQYLESILHVPKVDLALRDHVIEELQASIYSEAENVFQANQKMEVSHSPHAGSDSSD